MTSTLTLSTLRARVRAQIADAGGRHWSDERLDSGIRLALAEYSRASLDAEAGRLVRRAAATLVPALNARELDLSALAPPVVRVERIWYPYLPGEPAAEPAWVRFEVLDLDGKPVVFMLDACGDGISIARVFYRARHTLDDLDGATATTFAELDDPLIVVGSAGYAVSQRAEQLGDEDEAGSPPTGLAALATRWLADFRRGLLGPVAIRSRRLFLDE